MIKLLSLGAIPLLAAAFYGQPDSPPMVPSFHAAEQADRIFLAELNAREAAVSEQKRRDDREFLAQLQASKPVPVAVAVPVPSPLRATLPVLSIARAQAVSPTTNVQIEEAPAATPKIAEVSVPFTELTTRIEPEVRRAIPVTPHRAANVTYQGEVFVFPPHFSVLPQNN